MWFGFAADVDGDGCHTLTALLKLLVYASKSYHNFDRRSQCLVSIFDVDIACVSGVETMFIFVSMLSCMSLPSSTLSAVST